MPNINPIEAKRPTVHSGWIKSDSRASSKDGALSNATSKSKTVKSKSKPVKAGAKPSLEDTISRRPDEIIEATDDQLDIKE